MSQNKFCLIYYIVPEDKDDPEMPNAFGINILQEEVKLNDIKVMFPLEGEYIFRFKYKINNNSVWMDLPNETSKIPLYNGKIFMKATRISWESIMNSLLLSFLKKIKGKKQQQQQPNIEPTKKINEVPIQPQLIQQPQQQQQIPKPHMNLFGEEETTTFSPPPSIKQQQQQQPIYQPVYSQPQSQPTFTQPQQQAQRQESFANQLNHSDLGNLLDFDLSDTRKPEKNNASNLIDINFV